MFIFIFLVLVCVLVNEGLVELLSKSVFFRFLRDYFDEKTGSAPQFISSALKCPYCCSVWTSLFLTILVFIFYNPSLFDGFFIINFFLFLVLCHRLSNYMHDVADRYFTKEYLK